MSQFIASPALRAFVADYCRAGLFLAFIWKSQPIWGGISALNGQDQQAQQES